MGNPPTVQINMQQLALVMQDLAANSSLTQMGSGSGVFDGTGLGETLAQAPVIAVEIRANQSGRLEVNIAATGPVRLFTPPQAPVAKPGTGATEVLTGEPSVVYTHPDVVASALPNATNVTRAFSYSGIVFSQPQLPKTQTDQLPRSLIPSRTGEAPAGREAGRSGARPSAEAPGRSEAAPSSRGNPGIPVAVARPAEASARQVVELLTHLHLLPPGSRTEDVLPRLQEVVRLWNQETARNADLPADVVRVVNHFLASAVHSVDPQAQPSQAPQRSDQPQAQPAPRGNAREGAPTNPLFASSTPLPVSGASIAEAVRSVLFAAQAQVAQAPAQPQPPAQPHGQPLPQQGQRMPSMGPGAALGASGPQAQPAPVASRTEGMVRTDPATGRPLAREEVREPRVVVRPDVQPGERAQDPSRPVVVSEGNYDRDAHDDLPYQGDAALEALWPVLQQNLRDGGFIDDRNGSIRFLQSADEGRSLLALVSAHVPNGFDVIDLFELVGHKIGWAEKGRPVNEAYARLGNYRNISDGTKAGALLEPLRDAIMILGLGGDDLPEDELQALGRYEAHSPVAEKFLENQAWFARLENLDASSRKILEADLDESHALYADYLARRNPMRARLATPPPTRLLN